MFKAAALTLVRENSKILGPMQCSAFMQKTQLAFQTNAAEKADVDRAAAEALQMARPFKDMPYPSTFKIMRSYMPGGKYYKKDTNEMLLLMREEYGDVLYFPGLFGRPPMVMTFNPNDFETVFRNEGIWPVRIVAETLTYHRTTHRAEFFKGTEGLIVTQEEKWGKFRSIVNPILMQQKNVNLYLQKMSQVNREFIEKIRKLRDPATQEMPADFERMINRWTLELVSVVALDKQLGLLREDKLDPVLQKFLESINDFMTYTGELESKPSLWRIIATPKFKHLMNSLDTILDITNFYINQAMQRIEQEKKDGVEKPENEKGVMEKLLKIDPQVAIVMALDMLMAGVDPTSCTFVGILLCLAKNPEKQEKLREELRRILPTRDSEISENSLKDMPYLRACIKEALRIYPLVIVNSRVIQNDVVLSGYRVPKGTNVGMFKTSTNFDEKIFPNPHEFIPERWLRTGPNSLKTSNPFAHIQFSFGPRSCIGRRIAEMELELGVAQVIRNFNISYNHPMEKPFKRLIITTPNIPLKFTMTDVN